jgi:hypothetical protein
MGTMDEDSIQSRFPNTCSSLAKSLDDFPDL